jgi:hypothetical protein
MDAEDRQMVSLSGARHRLLIASASALILAVLIGCRSTPSTPVGEWELDTASWQQLARQELKELQRAEADPDESGLEVFEQAIHEAVLRDIAETKPPHMHWEILIRPDGTSKIICIANSGEEESIECWWKLEREILIFWTEKEGESSDPLRYDYRTFWAGKIGESAEPLRCHYRSDEFELMAVETVLTAAESVFVPRMPMIWRRKK